VGYWVEIHKTDFVFVRTLFFQTIIVLQFCHCLFRMAYHVVHINDIMQVRVLLKLRSQLTVPFKLRLKLIVMISLSIYRMTSQDRMCVQCVTSGLSQSII